MKSCTSVVAVRSEPVQLRGPLGRTDEMIGQLRRSPIGEASPDKDHASVRREEMVGLSPISDRIGPADTVQII
jgi:hypothetical protein